MADRDPSTPFSFPLDHVPVYPPPRHPLIKAATAFGAVITTGLMLYLAPVLTLTCAALGLGWVLPLDTDNTTEEK